MINKERELGDLLKDARIEKGWTVRHVARLVGISASYLSNIENGRNKNPSVSLLLSLSNCYELDLFKNLADGIYPETEIEENKLLNSLKKYTISQLEFIGVGINDLFLLEKNLLSLQRVKQLIEKEETIKKDPHGLFSNEELINELKKRGLVKERVSYELDIDMSMSDLIKRRW